MYIKCYAEPIDKYQRNYKIHLWDDEEGYIEEKYRRTAFIECSEQEAEYLGLNGEYLKETPQFKNTDDGLHFHDMPPHQRFLINKYGTDVASSLILDRISTYNFFLKSSVFFVA